MNHRLATGALHRVFPSVLPPFVAITVAGRQVRGQPDLRIHRVAALDIRDVRIHDGFPVTAPARTLIDVAGDAGVDAAAALNEARVLRLVTDAAIRAALGRCPGRTGTATIRALLQQEAETGFSRSQAECRPHAIVEQARLPRPQTNVRVAGPGPLVR
jgi:hypothetical protein